MDNGSSREKRRTGKPSLRMVWSAVMVAAYLGIAYLVFFTPLLLRYNAQNDPTDDRNFIPRLVLGTILVLYACFRGYRVWKEKR